MRGRGGCVIGTSLRLVVGSGRRGEEGGEEERIRIDGQEQENIPSLCSCSFSVVNHPNRSFQKPRLLLLLFFLSFFLWGSCVLAPYTYVQL